MEERKENKDKLKKKIVKIISFSTNHEELSPQSVISIYLSKINLSNIPLDKPLVEYDREMHYMNIHVKFLSLEILVDDEFDQKQFVTLCRKAQTFMFFIDLEYEQSFNNLKSIIYFIRNKIDPDFKIFIYGIYKNKEKIQDNLTIRSMESYLDSQRIFFDYCEVDLNDEENLIKNFDFITLEGINNITQINNIKSLEDYHSCSQCSIL
jgi:hypothetical protein